MNNLEKEIYQLIIEKDIDAIRLFTHQNKFMSYNFRDDNGKNLLHIAVESSSNITPVIIQHLLNIGVNANAIDQNFQTPLEITQKNNNTIAYSILKNYIQKEELELKKILLE